MHRAFRWRLIAAQVGVVVAAAFIGGFLVWGSNFVNGMIHDELASQQIYFLPATDAHFNPALASYAGQQVVTGDQARLYANEQIGRDLQFIGKGQTYSQVSEKWLANPTDKTLTAQRELLFQGETLRGLLLNAWGWSQVGTYAMDAAIGLLAVAGLLTLILVYELVLSPRREHHITFAHLHSSHHATAA